MPKDLPMIIDGKMPPMLPGYVLIRSPFGGVEVTLAEPPIVVERRTKPKPKPRNR